MERGSPKGSREQDPPDSQGEGNLHGGSDLSNPLAVSNAFQHTETNTGDLQKRLNLICNLQARLNNYSEQDCRAHREIVLRGVPTRGVKIPAIRSQVTDWANECLYVQDSDASCAEFQDIQRDSVVVLVPSEAKILALELMCCNPILDDKLAGMIFLSERLFVRDIYDISDLSEFALLFDAGHLNNFYVVDNFSDKVLSRFLHQGREEVAVVLSTWFYAGCIWRARAALLAFVPFAKCLDFRRQIRGGCVALLRRQEEEAKTTTGTLLRAISKPDADRIDLAGINFVRAFLDDDALLVLFSRAALTKATHHMERCFKNFYRRRCTQLQSQDAL